MPLGQIPGRLLDLGSGQGEDAVFYSRLGWSCVTLDQSISPGFRPEVLADGIYLPFKNGSFDAVILRHSLEHMENPGAVLVEVARILAPKGEVLLSTPMWNSWQSRLFGTHWYHLCPGQHKVLETRKSLEKIMFQSGLTMYRWSSISWEHDIPGFVVSWKNWLAKAGGVPAWAAWGPAVVLGAPFGLAVAVTSWIVGRGACQTALGQKVKIV